MRRYAILYMIAAASTLAGFLLFSTVRDVPAQVEVDMVAINELTKQASLSRHNLELLDNTAFPYRFFIVDNEDNVIYASAENLPDNAQSAIRLGFLPMDIMSGPSITGRLLIGTHPISHIESAYTRLTNFTIAAFVLLFALNLIFLSALHHAIIRPFQRFEKFAHKISAGQFDEPLPLNKNNPFGLFTQSFDIMRASLLEARQKQKMAERAQKELIASLSHDIKTPVTSIRLIAELLQVNAADPNMIEKLKTIEIKTDQIDRLMKDLMHSALEELGELHVDPISEKSGVLLDLFKSANYLSKVRLSPIPSCLIELDTGRMEQVIGNIIINSYKYAETDIDVRFSINGEGLQIDIDDYGTGEEPEALELITAKFYRGQNARASQKEGEGLGLYVSKLLMEKMGGGLEALNRHDGFSIRLWVRLSH